MNWFNIQVHDMREPAMLCATPAALGTWLRVMTYCCERENGGVIPGGAAWSDRNWMAACNVTLTEIKEAAPLIAMSGDDVVVANYPADKQAEIQGKREQAAKNAAKGGRPKKQAEKPTTSAEEKPTLETKEKPTLVSENKPTLVSVRKPEKEEEEEEEEEEEMEGELEQERELEKETESEKEGEGNHAAGKQPCILDFGEILAARQESNRTKLRLFALFGRKPTRLMTPKEDRAFRKANITDHDLTTVEEYYADSHPEWRGEDYRRRDLQTLLNNWSSDVDKADNWKAFGRQPETKPQVFSKLI